MKTPEYKRFVKSTMTRLQHPSMAPTWKALKERMEKFADATRRTWGSAIFYLLEKGLEAEYNGRNDSTDE